MPDEGAGDQFLGQLRRALQHLYDPFELRRNPLQNLLPLDPAPDRVQALRKLLQDAIQALRPGEDAPPGSNAWRIYDLLSYRFIEQSSQKEVAADMALSVRQLQRLEVTALEVLGEHLAARYGLRTLLDKPISIGAPGGDADALPAGGDSGPAEMSFEQEAEWLKKSAQSEEIALAGLVEATLPTLTPLIEAVQAQVQISIPSAIPNVVGQATVLRQALINLFTAALRMTKNGQVSLTAAVEGGSVQVRIITLPAARSMPAEIGEILSVAGQLAQLSRAALEITPPGVEGEPFVTSLILPAARRLVVLVIDDNQDTLRLLERYLAGSRYQFVSGVDPAQLFLLVETHRPDIILLDVMLPGIDGWDLLGRLKRDPATRAIPVIISTILPQESLAIMLGAADFLRKPFTREQLLAALEQQTAPVEQPMAPLEEKTVPRNPESN